MGKASWSLRRTGSAARHTLCLSLALTLWQPWSAAASAPGGLPGTATAGAIQGDPQRGRAIAVSRSQGLCVLCHVMPGVPANEAATIGPSLDGVASRHGAAELRERLLNPQLYNPQTVMPAYARKDHPGARLPESRRGRPLLDEQALADVLAYLATLK